MGIIATIIFMLVYDVTKLLRGLGDKREVDGIEDERMRRKQGKKTPKAGEVEP